MSSKAKSDLLVLATEIQQLTGDFVARLAAANLHEPTFDTDSEPLPETTDLIEIRECINDVAGDLLRLVNGPRNDSRIMVCSLYDLAAWQVACEFNFFEAIPEKGSASIKEIAKIVDMDEDRVGRFLRILATDRVFEEVEHNLFKHTSRSVFCLKDRQWRDVIHYQ
jgi:predicted transcriptional regulator